MGPRINTNRRLVVVVGLAVALFAVCVGLFYDLFENRMAQVGALNSTLLSLQKTANQSLALRHFIDTTKNAREKINLYFITKSTVGSLIEEIETYASRATVDLVLISPSVEKIKQGGKDKYLKFNVRTEGEFFNIIHFLRMVESMPYKTAITTVNIGKIDQEGVKKRRWFSEITFNLISYIDK
ncbi:MAG: hypothetical protein HY225_04215 [Candidatus Vogelbacteria bacterium]|nr:hypothetical protein [Candidatus Vogelbacteria bacterium]